MENFKIQKQNFEAAFFNPIKVQIAGKIY